ncbi:FHA domain-containing protein [Actinoplanes bogorensis]|uniref:FHA domain-containing protein n=1 Tax=Paractinoplanes bogorensis TaxID=1610840 RepID=A0ABS5Z0D0_9ACTN|nr:FHA domain-containing protein [Actinoplanes bogorensis]MBU2669148.1 FHA domain-containing protein [Actinoplanes bogorensis]
MLQIGVKIVVGYEREVHSAGVGESISIGRSHACDIQLFDPYISRRACLLQVEPAHVTVFNQSTHKPLVLRPPTGEDRRVGPLSASTSLPYGLFQVVFAGTDDRPVGVRVDARALSAPEPPGVDPGEDRTGDVHIAGRVALLTPAQRIALIALCEPLLTRNGAYARPRSTPELAQRLNLKPSYARNLIKDVRHQLAGLVSDDGDPRLALARWAVERGAVTVRDLADLPGSMSGPGETTRSRPGPRP